VYGIDINKKYEGLRHKVFQCDQSKIWDLNNVKKEIQK
ncbi:unnamed protein product, partial [marine sediment metagenome]